MAAGAIIKFTGCEGEDVVDNNDAENNLSLFIVVHLRW